MLSLLLALAACESSERHEPVVVYATAESDAELRQRFAAFTTETSIPVTFRLDSSAANTDNVIANKGSPPADVLLTDNVADIWRAADQGALRPVSSGALENVNAVLRDPDRMWVAEDVRFAAIAFSKSVKTVPVGDYASLAKSAVRGQLCLSSPLLPVNRALVAMLIDELGSRPAERIVRGWVMNLKVPPYETESELLEALASGECGYGILSSNVHDKAVRFVGPVPLYLNINGIGVVRHARYPESAQALVDWVIRNSELNPASSNGRNIGIAGWLDEDARLLADRAGYRD
jgi:iron(III) transport system substrate-binding protein